MAEVNLSNSPFQKVVSEFKIQGLKKEFDSIANKHLLEIATTHLLNEISCEYERFFIKYGLEDIQFSLRFNDNYGISFLPKRNIDRMAIIGILNTPDNIKITVSEEIRDNYINILKQLKK